MGNMGAVQHQQFHDRIGRIRSGGPNTNGQIYIGLDGASKASRRGRRRQETGLGKVVMLILAVVFGAAAMFAGRAGAFFLLSGPEGVPVPQDALVPLVTDIGIAAFLLFVFALVFRMGRALRLTAMMAGCIGVMLFEPLILQQAPEVFAQVFSEGYVAEQVASIPENPFSLAALGIDIANMSVAVDTAALGL